MVDTRLVIIVILYSILALLAFMGNIWVMTTVISQMIGCCFSPAQHPRRRTFIVGVQSSACLYLLLLSVVDMVSVVPVPFLISDLTNSEFYHASWLCKVIFSCEGANKSLSPFVLTALSVDRYIAVCKPTLIWMRQARFAFCIIIFCFLLSLCFIIPVTMLSEVTHMDVYQKCAIDPPRMFTILTVCLCYLMPLIFICCVYVAILRRLYQHTQLSSVGRRTSISLSRVVKCSVLVVMFYFICWTPYWIQQITIVIIPAPVNGDDPLSDTTAPPFTNHVGQMFMYLVHALPYTQSAFNWLFYAFLNHNLRHSSRCALGARSTATHTGNDVLHNTSSGTASAPLWRNIQNMGNYLKAASIDTTNTILRHSPFEARSRLRSKSCLLTAADKSRQKSNGLKVDTPSSFFGSNLDLPITNSVTHDNSLLDCNTFSPRATPDFPLLGITPVRSPSPSGSMSHMAVSLRVPPQPTDTISNASSVSLNIPVSSPSPLPMTTSVDNEDATNSIEWL